MEQAREKFFDRIILGLFIFGLVGSLAALALGGVRSIWFWAAVALFSATLIAFVLRSSNRVVVAAYVLVVALVILVTGLLLQTNARTSFTPYLFIPVVIIAGALLPPRAPIVTTVVSICLSLAVMFFRGQFTLSTLLLLLPPFSLTIIVALLMVESGRYANRLSGLLLENKQLLRDRTWETLDALKEAEELKQRASQLERQLQQDRNGASRSDRLAVQGSGLPQLVDGAVRELNLLVMELSQAIERIEVLPDLAQRPGLLAEAWHKIDRLTGLIVNLEELASLEGDKIPLDLQQVDPGRVISETVGIGRGLAREKNLELSANISEDLPLLTIDAGRVRKALLHVLNNAIKYTDEGTVEVSTKLTSQEFIIRVADTGIGIDQTEIDLIFQKFGRSQNPIARPRQGSGLGLALSDRLIALHSGRIWVRSQPNKGSTFFLSLPLTPAWAETQLYQETPAEASPTPLVAAEPAPPQSAVVGLPAEAEPTLISRQPKAGKLSVRGNLGPVARYGPTYIGRFGLTLLAILLLIGCIIGTLAFFNRGRINQRNEVDKVSPPLNGAVSTNQTPTKPKPIATPTVSASSPTTPAPLPTLRSTKASIPSPATSTVTAILAESLPFSPTPSVMATPSPGKSLSPSPAPSVTATPTPSPTPEAEPEPTDTAAAAVVPPTPVSRPSRLSFVVDDSGSPVVLFDSAGRSTGQASAIEPLPDGGLSWSGSGQLVFTSDRHGNRDLYLATAGDSRLQRLTDTPGDDTQAAWSPDGQYIAFSSGRTGNFEIYMMLADGTNLIQLTASRGFDEWPAWSPDGQQIAFVSDRVGNVDLYLMNADGSGQQQLTNHPADDWPARWSPDGRRLLFGSNRDGNWNLYLIDADGSDLTRLTGDPANEREPAWSPDGRSIAFAYDGGGNWDIYTLPVPTGSGTEIPADAWIQITDTPTDERFPTWQP